MATPEISRKIRFRSTSNAVAYLFLSNIPDIPNSPTLDSSIVPSVSVIAAGANADLAVASDTETLTDSESPSSVIDGGVDLRHLLSVNASPIHDVQPDRV